jgi:hypothetical protein
MFEIGIFGVILLAVAYCVILWMMGRRNDVLYGEFVQPRPEPMTASAGMPRPERPPANAESLRSLLALIEQELENAARL